MQYKNIGKSGIKVSTIGLGFKNNTDQKGITSLVKSAHEAGVNFFDNSEVHNAQDFEKAEKLFGNAIKELKIPREEIIVTSKVFSCSNSSKVDSSRKHIIESCRGSLRRLQLEYVDIIIAHQYDPHTTTEEICKGFHQIIEEGYAFYWGTSVWPASKIIEAIGICQNLNLHSPILEQSEYNMLDRNLLEAEYLGLLKEYKYGISALNPFCDGVLGEKDVKNNPQDHKLTNTLNSNSSEKFLSEQSINNTKRILKELSKISKELGCSQTQLALAWCLKNHNVSTVVTNAIKVSEIKENLKMADLMMKLNEGLMKKLNLILNNSSNPDVDWKTWNPFFSNFEEKKIAQTPERLINGVFFENDKRLKVKVAAKSGCCEIF